MTNEKAIAELKDDCTKCPVMEYRKGAECLDCYIAIAIEILEKQIPKKPIYDNDLYHCPNCGDTWNANEYEMNYCWDCGQAMDWSEE